MTPHIDHYELNIAATVTLSARTFHYAKVVFPRGLALGQAQHRAGVIIAGIEEEGLTFKYSLHAVYAQAGHEVAL